jgi:hypothetical protein
VSASRPKVGSDLLVHFVNYNRTEPAQKRSAGSGIVDEKPMAVEGIKAGLVLPAGFRARKVEALIPEEAGPVEVAAESKDGRLRFSMPKFLVYGVVRIQLEPVEKR